MRSPLSTLLFATGKWRKGELEVQVGSGDAWPMALSSSSGWESALGVRLMQVLVWFCHLLVDDVEQIKQPLWASVSPAVRG